MTVSFTNQRTLFCLKGIRSFSEVKMMPCSRSYHMQEVEQKAQHNVNGQETDPNNAQPYVPTEDALPVSLMSMDGSRTAVQAHKGMLVWELKELYRVCTHARGGAMRTCV
jgi:hypothetical protein